MDHLFSNSTHKNRGVPILPVPILPRAVAAGEHGHDRSIHRAAKFLIPKELRAFDTTANDIVHAPGASMRALRGMLAQWTIYFRIQHIKIGASPLL